MNELNSETEEIQFWFISFQSIAGFSLMAGIAWINGNWKKLGWLASQSDFINQLIQLNWRHSVYWLIN